MTGPRIGSLFTGTSALDLAVMDVYGGEVVWHSQYEPPDKDGREDTNQYAAKILERHWPDVPNLGDITKVDWQAVLDEHGPVDILTAGFPCQPFSTAGRRLGYQDERWLWDDVAHAIEVLQPGLVVLENVPGLFTAPGRQPDCVCGWNFRWGRHLGHLLADIERPDEVLADDDRADGEAACVERALGDARGTARGSGSTRPGARHSGDAPLGDRGDRSGVPSEGDAAAPDGEEGPGGFGAEDAWPRVAGFEEWARHLLDAGDFGGVAEGEGSDSGAEPSGDGSDRRVDCPACGRSVDESTSGPVRRAVGDVLGSLSRLGCDAQWINIRASEVGAPHQRKRVFILATAADAPAADQGRLLGSGSTTEPARRPEPGDGRQRSAADTPDFGYERGGRARHGWAGSTDRGVAAADAQGVGRGEGRTEPTRLEGRSDVAVSRGASAPDTDSVSGRLPDRHAIQRRRARHAEQAGVGGSHAATDTDSFRRRAAELELRPGQPDLDWGVYEPAVRRWEPILGRPAPWPTDLRGRLSPVFAEWMMGLPDGWVTCTPGLTRNAMLKALGNGVVRLQAATALRLLHDRILTSAVMAVAA